MTKFQAILTGLFIIFILLGVALFATSKSGNNVKVSSVVLWGTLPQETMQKLVDAVNLDNERTLRVTYVYKSEDTFERELIEALASGVGPDGILVPQDIILKQKSHLYPIPYQTFSARSFKDTFIEEGELFLTDAGILAFPFSVDPLIMYWNRRLLSSAGIVKPPTKWDEFVNLVPLLTKKNENGTIAQSAVAFGEFRNITNAEEVLSTLILQAGSPIVRVEKTGRSVSALLDKTSTGLVAGEEALRFYTDFANPVKPSYSWNRSLPSSQNAFVAGTLALYFGFASELPRIRDKNPNLNLDVAFMPQVDSAVSTYGKMTGVALLSSSKDLGGTFLAIQTLMSSPYLSIFAKESGLPPVTRELLSIAPTDDYQSIFYDSALVSKGYLNPDSDSTHVLFQNMVEGVTSGKLRISEAVSKAHLELDALLNK